MPWLQIPCRVFWCTLGAHFFWLWCSSLGRKAEIAQPVERTGPVKLWTGIFINAICGEGASASSSVARSGVYCRLTCSQLGTVAKSSRRVTLFEEIQSNRISFSNVSKPIYSAGPYKTQRDSSLDPTNFRFFHSCVSSHSPSLTLSHVFSHKIRSLCPHFFCNSGHRHTRSRTSPC